MAEKERLADDYNNEKIKYAKLKLWEYMDDKDKIHVSPDKLVQYFFDTTHYFNTTDNLAGFIYNGQYWVRIDSIKARDSLVRNHFRKLLAERYTTKLVTMALNITLDTALREDLKGVFEQNPNFASFKNTAINVETLQLLPNSPDLFILVGFNYEIDTSGNLPRNTLTFMQQLLGKGTQFICEYIGYMFKREYTPFQTFVIIQGAAGTGKSALFKIIIQLLEKVNVSSVGLQELANDRFMGANLVDKLANIKSDLPDKFVPEPSQIKNLTGDDYLQVQRKGEQPYNYLNHAKLLFSANRTPAIAADEGIDRRGIVVPVIGRVQAERDETGDLDLTPFAKEVNSFAYYCIKTYSKAITNGNKWSLTSQIIQATDDWLYKGDDIKQWTDDHLLKAEGRRPTSQLIYDEFVRDMNNAGQTKQITRNTFYARLNELGFEIKKSRSTSALDDHGSKIARRLFDYIYD